MHTARQLHRNYNAWSTHSPNNNNTPAPQPHHQPRTYYATVPSHLPNNPDQTRNANATTTSQRPPRKHHASSPQTINPVAKKKPPNPHKHKENPHENRTEPTPILHQAPHSPRQNPQRPHQNHTKTPQRPWHFDTEITTIPHPSNTKTAPYPHQEHPCTTPRPYHNDADPTPRTHQNHTPTTPRPPLGQNETNALLIRTLPITSTRHEQQPTPLAYAAEIQFTTTITLTSFQHDHA